MENHESWLIKPLKPEDVEIWFNVNNIIPEKMELYSDFCVSLLLLMNKTYLGFEDNTATKITITKEDNINHFDWCWYKTVSNFKRENIVFEIKGEHYDYFLSFFEDIFYKQENSQIREGLIDFFLELFDLGKPFTKADIELLTDLYKTMEKNMMNT